ncbi:Plug domain-containing protein [SAR86 cluster bacterium]|nr:Plug domain-containing protein [SAR86 cluster bacterium]
MNTNFRLLILFLATFTFLTNAQEADNDVEEVVVVGTQIKGAQINEALPVSIVTAEDIADLGIDSGDELIESLPEQGINQFDETGDTGGVNGVRGDASSFDIRSLGTGNTLVLLNGRRMISTASNQTEEIGGSFVPVESPNSQTLPLGLIDRVELLRDGAAAIYGSDAVAGVVNNVLDTDFEGFVMNVRYKNFEHFNRDDHTVTMKWGESFNEGRTSVSSFFTFYDRDRIRASEDEVMGQCDRRIFDTDGSLTRHDCSTTSPWAQLDMTSGRDSSYTDSAGEFIIYPAGHPDCRLDLSTVTSMQGVCAASDAAGNFYHNWYTDRDYVGDLQRHNFFTFLNHDMGNGMEMFAEFGYYKSDYTSNREQGSGFGSAAHVIPVDHPFNWTGKRLYLENYRPVDFGPRRIFVERDTTRALLGFRGSLASGWDWESAVVWSEARSEDLTKNRISNTGMDALLQSGLYNPFNGAGFLADGFTGTRYASIDLTPGATQEAMDTARIDVSRDSGRDLQTFDFRLQRPDLFSLPAGSVAVATGVEWRYQAYFDDRDPYLDGTIPFVRRSGSGAFSTRNTYTHPFVSNVWGSSATGDNDGSRTVTSFYAEALVPVVSREMNIPFVQAFDLQLAYRQEALSDVEGEDVSRFAFGWRVSDAILLRGSFQETFRAPNLYTVYEGLGSRVNARYDWAAVYVDDAATAAGLGSAVLWDSDGRYSVIRNYAGTTDLKSETADNTTLGIVIEPLDGLSLTYDTWEIESDGTVGLFGEDNSMLLDLVLRLQSNDLNNCNNVVTNPDVFRSDPDEDEAAAMIAVGICPFGQADRVLNEYENLGVRLVSGWDAGAFYDVDLPFGSLTLKHQVAFWDKKSQEIPGKADPILAAYDSGLIDPVDFPLVGFGELVKIEGTPKMRTKSTLRLRTGAYTVGLTQTGRSEVLEPDVALRPVAAFSRLNAYVDYRFDLNDANARLRFGVNNVHDRRAPLADYRFGFLGDLDNNTRRSFYLDFRVSY